MVLHDSFQSCSEDHSRDGGNCQNSILAFESEYIDRPMKFFVLLVVVLHGYSVNGITQLAYSRINDLVDDDDVFVMAPDGMVDDSGNRFWNATRACCDFFGTQVDDSGYLRNLIEEVSGVYNIDLAMGRGKWLLANTFT